MIAITDWLDGLPFLDRLGVVTFAASALCTGIAWSATLFLKRRSAALRCHIWFASFLSIGLLVAIQISGFTVRVPVLEAPPTISTPSKPKVAIAASPLPATTPVAPQHLEQTHPARGVMPSAIKPTPQTVGWWLTMFWMLGVTIGLIRIFSGLVALSVCARSSASPAPNGNVARFIAEFRMAGCQVRLHPAVYSPISFGWLRTWILLPPQADEWSVRRLRIVLRHEFAHGERRDFLTTCVMRVITAFCWPNPLAWLGLRRFRELCEDATDDRVAANTDATVYADELLKLLRDLRMPSKRFRQALSISNGSSPRVRIARLLNQWIDRSSPTRTQIVLILAFAAALAVSFGTVRIVRAESSKPAASMSKEEAAWAKKLTELRLPTPAPKSPPKREDFSNSSGYMKALSQVWGPYWAKEYPRLWTLAETDREFLRRFPKSAQAPTVRKDMTDSVLSCLDAKDPLGKQALAWLNETLAQRHLSPADALPIYSYQMNMIGIMCKGIDSLVPTPHNNEDVPEAADELLAMFAKRYPATPELGTLYYSASHYVEREDRKKALHFLDQAQSLVKDEKELAQIEGARFRLTAEGRPIPNLDFTAMDGRNVDIKKPKGKVVLLDFWATWCGPCVSKIPEIKLIEERWRNQGLEVIGISLDSDRATLSSFIQKNKLPWPQYFDGKGWANDVAAKFGVQSIPSAWIIDQQGKIVAVDPPDIAPILEKLLGQGDLPKGVKSHNAASLATRQQSKGSMSVRVVDANGKPIAGATVHHSVWTEEPFKHNADYTTNTKGEVTFKLPHSMSILRLWVSKESYVPLSANWEVEAENDVTFPEQQTFVLEKGTRIGGFVVDEKGDPIVGAKVEVSVSDQWGYDVTGRIAIDTWLATGEDARVTDARGFWSLDNAPADKDSEFSIKLSHPDFINDKEWGFYQKEQNVTSAQLRAQTARIALPRGISLSGTIEDADGKPLQKAVVIWGDDPYSEEGSQEVLTDAQGKYRLPPHLPGPLTLTVAAPGWSPEQKDVTVASSPDPVNFHLKPGKLVRIQFVDDSGHPIPDVLVGLETWHHKRALYNIRHPNVLNTRIPDQADKKGVYEWTWAPGDTVKYSFWKDGYQLVKNQMLGPGDYRIELSK